MTESPITTAQHPPSEIVTHYQAFPGALNVAMVIGHLRLESYPDPTGANPRQWTEWTRVLLFHPALAKVIGEGLIAAADAALGQTVSARPMEVKSADVRPFPPVGENFKVIQGYGDQGRPTAFDPLSGTAHRPAPVQTDRPSAPEASPAPPSPSSSTPPEEPPPGGGGDQAA